MNLKPFICIGEDRENRRRKQKKKSRGRGRSRARLKGEDGGSVSKEGLDSVSKQCIFWVCSFFFNGESLLLPDHESLSVDRDWRVQSSKNEETFTLIEYATPDERGWSFGSVLM